MTRQQGALLGLAALTMVLAFLVVHLTFFAAEGGRYTAAEGRQDRADSMARDTSLAVRLGELERQLAAHTHD